MLVMSTWFAIFLVWAGYIQNGRKKRSSQVLWVIGNVLWLNYGLFTNQPNLVFSNAMSTLFAIVGWYMWSVDLEKRKQFLKTIDSKSKKQLIEYIRSSQWTQKK